MTKTSILKIRKFLMAVFLAVGVIGIAGCGSDEVDQEAKVVNIGFTGTGDAWNGGAVGMAQVNGYYEEELAKIGYKPNMIGFSGLGPAMNEAFASGNLDYGFYAEIPWVTAVANGIDLELVSVTQIGASGTITVPKGSDIQSLEDLRGKKVGYTRGTVYHTFLIRVLESVGLTVDDVELVNLNANDMVSALEAGNIDAASLTAGNALRIESEYGGRIITWAMDNPDEWASLGILVVRPEYQKENPEVTEALIRATLRGREAAAADMDAFYAISAEKGNLTLESLKKLYPAGDDGKFTYTYPIEITDSALNILKSTGKLMYESELTPKDFNVEDYIDRSYYEKVKAGE